MKEARLKTQAALLKAMKEKRSSSYCFPTWRPIRTHNWSAYDFIDLGCSSGGSLGFVSDLLSRLNKAKRDDLLRGVGIDKGYGKVCNLPLGSVCILADVLEINIPKKCVPVVSMMDFLEHLPTPEHAEKCIAKYVDVATDCIFIFGPYFDAYDYLKSLNFKLFHNDWLGHSNPFKITDLKHICNNLNLKYKCYPSEPIKDSSSNSILPWNAPVDQLTYDPKICDTKTDETFKEGVVYEYFYAVISIKNTEYTNEINKLARKLSHLSKEQVNAGELRNT